MIDEITGEKKVCIKSKILYAVKNLSFYTHFLFSCYFITLISLF